ncbi:hypothetical protein BH11MYX4_BH11MYX4_07960 [soil metagenome]
MLPRPVATHALLVCAALGWAGAFVACNRDTDLGAGRDAGAEGASGVDAGHGINVTTVAPQLTAAAAAAASATWAAYQLDDGPWQALAPAATGTYAFAAPAARWALALACASEDSALTTVFIHRRTAATHDLEATLEEQCTPPPPAAEFALTGTISNLTAATKWLEFAYARDTRGGVLPVTAGRASYEQVAIAPGSWDFGFGLRDDSFGALTRIALLRATPVTGDRALDVDAAGATSFVPGSKRLVLRGLDASDTVTPRILYAAGGPQGIDVGPQDVPVGEQDVTLAYATVPEGAQLAGDRYHGILAAERDRREAHRAIDFRIHPAIDLDVALLPTAGKPVVTVVASAPQVRLATRFAALPQAERYEVRAVAALNRRTQHAWHATYDAAAAPGTEIVDTLPDLSALPGWRSDWALPVGVTATVTVTSFEAKQALGDGTMQRATASAMDVTP